MDEKAPKIDDKKFAAHMDKNKKTKTMNSTQKSLKDIRGRAEIVRSKKSTAQMRNSAGLKRVGEGMENMCCKNCGDMFGKPTKENKSCMYDAYNREGKNWIKKESYREAVITPKMQKRALASPAAKAKPKSQVTLPKMPKLSIDKDKKKTNESFDFKVNIDGFPEMFMSGNSPSEVKTHLRKLVKQPSMIQSVDRVTKADKKQHHRDKVKESVELDEAKLNIKRIHKAVDDGKSMDAIVGMFANRRTTNTDEIRKIVKDYKFKKRMKEDVEEQGKGLWHNIHMKRKRGEKMRKKGEKGAPTPAQMARAKGEAVSPAQQAAIAISKKKKEEGAMSRIASTGSTLKKPKGLDTFRKKPKESYAPDEGTPEAKKKASKMTPGQEGVGDFLRSMGRKVMGNKPTANQTRQRVNTNRGSTSGQQNSIANRINFGGKYGNK